MDAAELLTMYPEGMVTWMTAYHAGVAMDLDGKVIYRASYTGETRGDELWVSSGTAEEYLSKAMSYAIQESLRDEVLVQKLEMY